MISSASLKAVWNFRGFVLGSVRREFQLKYRGSMLGIAWTVLQPLAMIIVYTVIFSEVMKAKLPGVEGSFAYSIHLCAGLLTWGLFAEIVQRGQSVFLDNANLLKKINFPRLTLPLIVVSSALLNFAIIFGLFLLFLLISGNLPGISIVAIIPLLVVQVLFAVGLGVALGVLNVFFRDVGQLSGVLMQFWFWATPVVYPVSILPDWAQTWMQFNPMYHLIKGYQDIFVVHQWPEWKSLAVVTGLSVLLAVFALHLFRKRAGEIVDEL